VKEAQLSAVALHRIHEVLTPAAEADDCSVDHPSKPFEATRERYGKAEAATMQVDESVSERLSPAARMLDHNKTPSPAGRANIRYSLS
jgi:hypothetical protein